MLFQNKYDLPDELYYQAEHTYARVEGDIVVIGASDYAAKLAGTIKLVTTYDIDEEIFQNKPFGKLSSGKWNGAMRSPISGVIVEINEEADDDPRLINQDPYGEGWIIKVRPSDLQNDLARLQKGGTPEFLKFMEKDFADKSAQGLIKD